jgi:hypothetical protein
MYLSGQGQGGASATQKDIARFEVLAANLERKRVGAVYWDLCRVSEKVRLSLLKKKDNA